MTTNKSFDEVNENNIRYWEERIADMERTILSEAEMNKELIHVYGETRARVQTALLAIATKIDNNNYTVTDFYKYDRMNRFQQEVSTIINDLRGRERAAINHLVMDSYTTGRNLLRVSFHKPNQALVKKLVERPWIGNTFSERVWHNSALLENSLNNTLKFELVQGTSIQKIARSLANECDVAYKRALTLARTEANHYMNEGTKDRYKEMDVEQVEIITAHDNRVCKTCQKYDRRIYNIDKTPILPLHPNCRCTIVPIIK